MPITVSRNPQEAVSLTQSGNALRWGPIFGNEDQSNPLSCGIISATEGKPASFKSPSTGFVLVLEGEIGVEDQANPGEQIILKPGDVVRVDKGTNTNWNSPTVGKGFYVGQVAAEENLEKHLI